MLRVPHQKSRGWILSAATFDEDVRGVDPGDDALRMRGENRAREGPRTAAHVGHAVAITHAREIRERLGELAAPTPHEALVCVGGGEHSRAILAVAALSRPQMSHGQENAWRCLNHTTPVHIDEQRKPLWRSPLIR